VRLTGSKGLRQELNCPTRVVRIFPNQESPLQLVTAQALDQSVEWVSGRRFLDMAMEKSAIRVDLPVTHIAATADQGWRTTTKTETEELTEFSGLD